MKYFKTILFTVLSFVLFGQDGSTQEVKDILQNASFNSLTITQLATNGFDLSKQSLEGSAFLFDDWQELDLELKRGDILEKFLMNYNLSSGQVLLKDEEKYYNIDLQYIKGFDKIVEDRDFKERKFASLTYGDKEELFEVLVAGDYTLYKHYAIQIIKPNYNKALNVGVKNTKIKKDISYFIKHDGLLVKLPSKRRKAYKELSDLEPIVDYIKSEKIDLANENELESMTDFINSL